MDSTLASKATQLASTDDVLAGVGGRLQVALRHLSLSQSDVCRRVGVSSGFLSDVIRGKKKPGAELLLELRRVIGISSDWLLTGEGSMFATGRLNQDLLHAIRVQTEIARAAEEEGDAVAQEFVEYVLKNREWPLLREKRFAELLVRLSASDSDNFAIQLYDTYSGQVDEVGLKQAALREAVNHFRFNKRADPVSRYMGRNDGRSAVVSGNKVGS